MQKINKNTMTIKISILYHQWMQYGKDKCMECRKNKYGDIYFVMDISFLLIIRRFNFPPCPLFSYIVYQMKKHDKGDAVREDISLYFDFESKHLFHDRELKDRATILYLAPTLIADELRDRICLFPNTMVLMPNMLFMGHCGINGHIALLGKIKRISELLMVEKKQEYMNDMSDIQVKDDSLVYFASSPFNTPIVTIW